MASTKLSSSKANSKLPFFCPTTLDAPSCALSRAPCMATAHIRNVANSAGHCWLPSTFDNMTSHQGNLNRLLLALACAPCIAIAGTLRRLLQSTGTYSLHGNNKVA